MIMFIFFICVENGQKLEGSVEVFDSTSGCAFITSSLLIKILHYNKDLVNRRLK